MRVSWTLLKDLIFTLHSGIALRLAGDDPLIALRERPPEPAEFEAIIATPARIETACPTPWTTR